MPESRARSISGRSGGASEGTRIVGSAHTRHTAHSAANRMTNAVMFIISDR
jgi:hypothetical protein